MKAAIISFISAMGLFNISLLFKGLNDVFKTDTSWISDEASEILGNPKDKEEIEKAVSELKKSENSQSQSVTLSDGRTINIRIG